MKLMNKQTASEPLDNVKEIEYFCYFTDSVVLPPTFRQHVPHGISMALMSTGLNLKLLTIDHLILWMLTATL